MPLLRKIRTRRHASCCVQLRNFTRILINNQAFIPNYGERYRQGDRISTGFVESAVNYVVAKRFNKRQQMQWSPKGAHLLLQMRTQVLNGELEPTFRKWHPGFRAVKDEKLKKVA
jgi:hypothetical protein